MACECIADLNRRLDGQEIETTFAISKDLTQMSMRTFTPLIRKDKQTRENRRSKPSLVAHKYCPFCGQQYDAAPGLAVAA